MNIFRIPSLVFLGWGLVALIPSASWAQSCSKGENGDVTIPVDGGPQVLNTYYPSPLEPQPVVVDQGVSTIRVDPASQRGGPSIVSGDMILIVQMQGAPIHVGDETNPGGPYGDGPEGLDRQGVLTEDSRWIAGRYEINRAVGPISEEGNLSLVQPTKHAYQSSDVPEGDRSTERGTGIRRYQVVRIPSFGVLTVEGQLTGVAWDGRTGGIIALDAQDQMVINGLIDASGLGFRGGLSTLPGDGIDLHLLGRKAEGVAGTPIEVRNRDRSSATRSTQGYFVSQALVDALGEFHADSGPGAPGNAGGAAVTPDSGGAGGGGYGAGGSGGCGRLEEAVCDQSLSNPALNPGFIPNLGGAGLTDNTRLFIGGGGGGGMIDDVFDEIRNGAGGFAGGGLVLLRAPVITGQGGVIASGQDAEALSSEGGSGGGGGGQIWLVTNSEDLSGLELDATGGDGGSVSEIEGDAGGGGGGGGLVTVVTSPDTGNAQFVGRVQGGAGGQAVSEDFRVGQPGADGVAQHLRQLPESMTCVDTDTDPDTDTDTDTDGDGQIDTIDLDDDNDGILDTVEQVGEDTLADADGDGVPNHLDRDSDNDGVADTVEAGGVDSNNDGEVDNFVDDNPANGADDRLEDTPLPLPDTDEDGVPDYLDVDSDGDGITDPEESGLIDADGDGVADNFVDINSDGVRDSGLIAEETQSDDDDLQDRLDIDSDNDQRPDATEGHDGDLDGEPDTIPSGVDSNGNGLDDAFEPSLGGTTAPLPDADGDLIPDYQDPWDQDSDDDGEIDSADLDDDNDGLLDTVEQVDGNLGADADGDGVPNHMDRDSDNDGVGDTVEAGGVDSDNDGEVDDFVDEDPADGADDRLQMTPLPVPDTDGDGVPDYLDVDSDGDGITDPEESGLIDADGDGFADGFQDTDNDGVRDSGLIAEETRSDDDDLQDRLDLDSDGDERPDALEGHDGNLDGEPDTTPSDEDSNGNGLDDAFDPALGGTPAPLPDADGDGIYDYQDPTNEDSDVDDDGLLDAVDLDDDNDGILDTDEQIGGDTRADADGDGVPNHLDRDSDNDGVADTVEAGGVDGDNNGEVDNFIDEEPQQNGVDDQLEENPLPMPDTDEDGLPDWLDVDSDGDGITDPEESGLLDVDGDGMADDFQDTNGDGVRDSGLIEEETRSDDDDLQDRLDLDSDNDGLPDATEGHDDDGDGEPDTVPGGEDSNANGLDDAFEPSLGGTTAPLPDVDDDGIADYQDPVDDPTTNVPPDTGTPANPESLWGLAGGGGCQSTSAPATLVLWLLCVPLVWTLKRRAYRR